MKGRDPAGEPRFGAIAVEKAWTHYFTQDWDAPSERRTFSYEIHGERFLFSAAKGLFSRDGVDAGTDLLLRSTLEDGGWRRGLDLGCGYGVIGIALARFFPGGSVVMTDISFLAARMAAMNVAQNRVAAVTTCGLGATHLRGGVFDLVALNPPLRAGNEQVFSLFHQGIRALTREGRLYFVARKAQGALTLAQRLRDRGLRVDEKDKRAGFRVFVARPAPEGQP